MRDSHAKTVKSVSSDIHTALLREQISKDIDNGVLEYFRDDKNAPNADINLFLKTEEWQDFLKKMGYDSDLGACINTNQKNVDSTVAKGGIFQTQK